MHLRSALPGVVASVLAAVLSAESQSFAQANPSSLERLWEFRTPAVLPQAVVPAQGHLFVALKSGGVGVYRLASGRTPPKLVTTVPRRSLGQLDAMHLVRHGNRLYVALGDFFAAAGARAGLAVVDIVNAARPRVLGVWTSATLLKGAAAVVVDDRYAYLGAMTEGVMIFDVSNPSRVEPVSTFQPDVNFPRANPGRVQHPNARGLALAGNLLYVAYDAGGVRVLDISDRSQPREVGRYVNAAMAGKQQAYNTLAIAGRYAYVAVDYAGLEILDVSDPAAIRQTGWWNPWRADSASNVWFNSPGHTNQLVLEADRGLVYMSAGDSDLQVVDVSDPNRPVLTATYGSVKDGRGVWGAAVGSEAVYLAYIQALVPFRGTWSGLVAVERPRR